MVAKFILASASPRRRELLSRLGIEFEVQPAGSDENLPDNTAPQTLVSRLALTKALDVARRDGHDEALVLGADTCIDLEGQVLGKPCDGKDALNMLMSLSGRSHQVLTGTALLHRPSGRAFCSVVSTTVRMAPFGLEQARRYVEGGEPMDKAGAYAIQGQGRRLVQGIEGCFNNVVGLPLCEVARLFRSLTSIPLPAICGQEGDEPCPRLPGLASLVGAQTSDSSPFREIFCSLIDEDQRC